MPQRIQRITLESDEQDKPQHDNEEEFYEGVAKVADFVNQKLVNSISPGGLNNTVEENEEDDKGEK